eukprot:CAMPEP_0176022840 /NCGR_PEP_ID=MMETSP0120_2-20121206/11129_1 /TAXON_ID=160619 /ORGANISM="Kryptoperidinium foliaceum, Strain CCMP 1326" /LENGTH=377 /DNA_ID=CAMNT_0017355991 /DNA_START=172 /DNA_END=1307 /DNA_ORIENTATION=-
MSVLDANLLSTASEDSPIEVECFVPEAPVLIGSSGCSAGCQALQLDMRADLRAETISDKYASTTNKPHRIATSLSQMLYSRLCVASALDSGEGHVYVYDAKGHTLPHVKYTCGMGALGRPFKEDWKTNGAVLQTLPRNGIPQPYIRPFVAPTQPDLSQHQVVLCFGDSMIENFCGKFWNKHRFRHENVQMKHKIGSELSMETYKEEFLDKIEELYGSEILKSSNLTERQGQVATILTGSAVWDLLEPHHERDVWDWKEHLEACRLYIETLRQRYPRATIYWKLPTAIHVHKLNDECFHKSRIYEACRIRNKYMSNSLMYHLYALQKDLMQELQVPILDLYQASSLSACWLMPGDGRHYRQYFNELMSNYYYPGSHLD